MQWDVRAVSQTRDMCIANPTFDRYTIMPSKIKEFNAIINKKLLMTENM